MKRPTLASENMVSLYSGGRNYIPQSSKATLSSYQKPFGLSFNSPKGEAQKSFAFSPKQQNTTSTSVRIPTKPEQSESALERKNSKNNSESYSKMPISMSAYMGQAASSSRQAKIRGSSTNKTPAPEKPKDEQPNYNPRGYTGLKYSESLNLKDSLLKQKPYNLEINTDIQTYKTTGGIRAYSTKNSTSKSTMGGPLGANQSGLDYSKYLNNPNSSKYEYVRTDPSEDIKSLTPTSKPKNALSRILSNTNDKNGGLKKQTTYDEENLDQDYSAPNSTKINNFFASAKRKELEGSMVKKERTLNVSTKVEQPNQKGDAPKSATLAKKSNAATGQLEYKSSYKAFAGNDDSQDDIKQESKNLSLSTANTTKAGTSSKSPLNSFITKVDKGSALPIRPNREEGDESVGGTAPARPYLNLASGSKTTTNAESKTITFSKAKLNQQALASSSQDSAKGKGRSTGASTPLKRGGSKDGENSSDDSSPASSTFTYYATSLEKHHRNRNDMDYFCQLYKEHFIQSFQALTFCKYLRPVDPKVLAQKKVFLPKRISHKDKKTVIFDLDETLIHCNESTDMPSDVILPIRFPHGEIIEAGINIRPGAVEILKEISQHFEVIIFTASHSCYANVVLDYLDPHNQYIHHRLFRENCVVTEEGIYIKDLRILGNRNLADCVLVDNAAYSFGYQVENGIPCVPFYDNKEDQELMHLIPYLKSLAGVKDVRDVNRQTFKFHNYTMYDSLDKVLNKVVLQN